MNRWLLGGLAALALAGCATVTTAPEPAPDPWQPAKAYALWESVLEAHVDERGRVDFAALEERTESLERFVA